MRFNPEEITSVIRKELEEFESKIDISEVGTILEGHHLVVDGASTLTVPEPFGQAHVFLAQLVGLVGIGPVAAVGFGHGFEDATVDEGNGELCRATGRQLCGHVLVFANDHLAGQITNVLARDLVPGEAGHAAGAVDDGRGQRERQRELAGQGVFRPGIVQLDGQ